MTSLGTGGKGRGRVLRYTSQPQYNVIHFVGLQHHLWSSTRVYSVTFCFVLSILIKLFFSGFWCILFRVVCIVFVEALGRVDIWMERGLGKSDSVISCHQFL